MILTPYLVFVFAGFAAFLTGAAVATWSAFVPPARRAAVKVSAGSSARRARV